MTDQRVRGFQHELDGELFALDRLDRLIERAGDNFRVQFADEGLERPSGQGPVFTTMQGPVAEDVVNRKLHLHFHDADTFAPEYATARDHILEAAGVDPSAQRFHTSVVIRIFSPEVPVSLHADGETQIDCGVGGRNAWHFIPRGTLTPHEEEALLRGGQFLPWRESSDVTSFDLHPGEALIAQPREPHWVTHPGPDPAVSFEVGYWTPGAVRERKVWEINWLLRKARIEPTPPGVIPGRDRIKQRVFDVVSMATGKGREYRGV